MCIDLATTAAWGNLTEQMVLIVMADGARTALVVFDHHVELQRGLAISPPLLFSLGFVDLLCMYFFGILCMGDGFI